MRWLLRLALGVIALTVLLHTGGPTTTEAHASAPELLDNASEWPSRPPEHIAAEGGSPPASPEVPFEMHHLAVACVVAILAVRLTVSVRGGRQATAAPAPRARPRISGTAVALDGRWPVWVRLCILRR